MIVLAHIMTIVLEIVEALVYLLTLILTIYIIVNLYSMSLHSVLFYYLSLHNCVIKKILFSVSHMSRLEALLYMIT